MVGGALAGGLLGVAQVAVFSRFLGRAGYGRLALVMGAVAFVKQIVGVRVWEWVTRDLAAAVEARRAGEAADVFRAGLVVSAAVNAVTFVATSAASGLLAAWFVRGQVGAGPIVLYAGTLAASWSYDSCFATLRVLGQFRYLAIQGVVSSAVRVPLLAAVLFASTSAGLADDAVLVRLLGAYVIYEAAFSTQLLLKARRELRAALGPRPAGEPRRSLRSVVARAKGVLFVGSILDTVRLVATRADVLVLGWFVGLEEVALYTAANNFIDGISRVVSPLPQVVFSRVARLAAAKKVEELLALVRKTAWLGLAGGAGMAAALHLLAPALIRLVNGPAYADAVPLLRVLAVIPIWLAGIWMAPTFTSVGRLRWSLEFNLVIVAGKLLALALLVPSSGAWGLAVVNAGYYAVVPLFAAAYYVRVRRLVRSEAFRAGAEEPAR